MIQPLRIAVADDEPDIRQYFHRLLPKLGYEVVGEAENGMELVELCRTTKPDLVITDVMMPEMTGIEAAAEISKSLTIPIIILSSHERPGSDDGTANIKCKYIVDYLRKPVSIPDLQAAITRACSAA
ncbi:response regulator [Novipirellula sp. SH528]|uniref:response regulator n=1 Tax=Novipirellula sp. SH528 TaxID=3454466 RepID=UPI003FA0D4E5